MGEELDVKKLVDTLYYQTQEKQALKKTLQEITTQVESERNSTLELLKKYAVMKKRYRSLKMRFALYVGGGYVGALVVALFVKYVL